MLLGILLALGASVSWALANVAIQRSGRAVGPWRALLWAQIAGGAGLVIVAPLLDRPTAPLDASAAGTALVAGASALLAYVCLFVAFEGGRLSITVPIMSSWSVISAGIGIGLFGERLRPSQIAGAVLVVVGVVLVARSASTSTDAARPGPRDNRALWASVGAAVGFGVLIPAIDRLSPVVGRLGVVPVVYGLDILLGLPIALAARINLRPPPAAAWRPVAAAGFLETVGFVFISLAQARAPVAVVSPTASLSAALTVVYAWLVLRERPGRLAAFGAATASAGVVTLAL